MRFYSRGIICLEKVAWGAVPGLYGVQCQGLYGVQCQGLYEMQCQGLYEMQCSVEIFQN